MKQTRILVKELSVYFIQKLTISIKPTVHKDNLDSSKERYLIMLMLKDSGTFSIIVTAAL